MNNNMSFYGGRRGAPFLITKSFSSIDSMISAFRSGINYTEVNFDEYAIISTGTEYNSDNGKIFRRGYDYTNDMGGAIYIGTITGAAGPPGLSPQLKIDNYDNILNQSEQYPIDQNHMFSKGEWSKNIDLIPGKVSDNNFNDSIHWVCYSVKTVDDTTATAYLGLKIPYMSYDFEGQPVDIQSHKGSWVKKIDDGSHPFYTKLRFDIPKGEKGDSFNNLRVVIASVDTVDPYPGIEEDIRNKRKILVYDYYSCDNSKLKKHTLYVGDYNMISDIQMENDGTLKILYTHDSEKKFPKKIKWIDKITLDSQSKKIQVFYNNGTNELIGEPINYIEKTALTDDFHIIVYYSDPLKRQQIVAQHLNYPFYQNSNEWHDLGGMKEYSGILIGEFINPKDHLDTNFNSLSESILYLNKTYPEGLLGINLKGKIIAIGDVAEEKKLYAFNYGKGNKSWYYLGSIKESAGGSSSGTSVKIAKEPVDEQGLQNLINEIPVNGLWLIEEEVL